MELEESEGYVGTDAATTESLVLAPVTVIILTLETELVYYLVYVGAVLLLMFLIILRHAAGMVNDPNVSALFASLKASTKLMQLVFVGTIASLCLHTQDISTTLSPLTVFIILASAVQVSTIYIGEMWLRNYLDFWREVVQETTEDNVFGRRFESLVVSRIDQFQELLHESSIPEPEDRIEGLGFAFIVFMFILIIGLPVWGILASLSSSPGIAIMTFFSILFLRDISRYLYVEFGAADRFSQLTLGTKWEVLWTALVAILLAGTLGYDLSPLISPW